MAGSAVMFVVTSAMALISLLSISSIGNDFEKAANVDAKKLDLVSSIGADAAEMLAWERGMLLRTYMNQMATAQKNEESFEDFAKRTGAALDELRPLIATEQGRRDLNALTEDLAASIEAQRQSWALAQSRQGKAAAALYEARLLPLEPKMKAEAEDLKNIERGLIAGDLLSGRANVSRNRWTTVGVILVFAVVGVVVMLVIRKTTSELCRITIQLAEGKDQVSSAATQVAGSSQALAQGASEQAASLEETSASVEEITSMVKKNAENSRSVADLMGDAERLVKDGNGTLEQMVISMQEINASSDKIGKIIKVIDEIAFQTNILALNAAVEAARAGEAGMGFAVVADEVRNLAQRSAQAAKDTAALIEESIAKSSEGKGKLQQVTEVIRAITESSSKVKMLVDEVNLGSQEQARGIDEISKAVQQMNQLTQNTAANAEESASASEELSAQANTMGEVVARLKEMVERDDVETPRTSGFRDSRGAGVKAAALARRPAEKLAGEKMRALAGSCRGAIPLEDEFTEF